MDNLYRPIQGASTLDDVTNSSNPFARNKPATRMGYRVAHIPGQPCRSAGGHIYYREGVGRPIIRLSHKVHVLIKSQVCEGCPLSPRQMRRILSREAASRAIAARFPAQKV